MGELDRLRYPEVQKEGADAANKPAPLNINDFDLRFAAKPLKLQVGEPLSKNEFDSRYIVSQAPALSGDAAGANKNGALQDKFGLNSRSLIEIPNADKFQTATPDIRSKLNFTVIEPADLDSDGGLKIGMLPMQKSTGLIGRDNLPQPRHSSLIPDVFVQYKLKF